MQFRKATKTQARLRLALIGPSGSGKTYTALRIAKGLGGRVAVIDTERGSASKYADLFAFDVLELDTFSPVAFVEAIGAAEAEGYDVIVVDSLSHAWMGKGGALEQVDEAAKRSKSGNNFMAWREVTPLHNRLVDSVVRSKAHIIATMRAKTEYVLEKDERTGKTTPRKIGLAPVQRDGLEYEFDVVADLTTDLDFIVSKTRCPLLAKAVVREAGEDVAATLRAWLSDGVPEGAAPAKPATTEDELADVLLKIANLLELWPVDGRDKAVAEASAKEKDGKTYRLAGVTDVAKSTAARLPWLRYTLDRLKVAAEERRRDAWDMDGGAARQEELL